MVEVPLYTDAVDSEHVTVDQFLDTLISTAQSTQVGGDSLPSKLAELKANINLGAKLHVRSKSTAAHLLWIVAHAADTLKNGRENLVSVPPKLIPAFVTLFNLGDRSLAGHPTRFFQSSARLNEDYSSHVEFMSRINPLRLSFHYSETDLRPRDKHGQNYINVTFSRRPITSQT